MDVGDAMSTTSMDVVKVNLENQVGLKSGAKVGFDPDLVLKC